MLCLCGMVCVVGCHSATGEHAAVPAEQTSHGRATTMTGPGPKTPEEPKHFVPGPAIRPTGPLLDWLKETVPSTPGPRPRVRLPVTIRLSQDRRIAYAFIGTLDSLNATIFLKLDDSRMGTALLDYVREQCSKSEPACAVWLDGYWDSLIPLPTGLFHEGMDVRQTARSEYWSFGVVRLHELIEGTTDEEAVHAQIESPSP